MVGQRSPAEQHRVPGGILSCQRPFDMRDAAADERSGVSGRMQANHAIDGWPALNLGSDRVTHTRYFDSRMSIREARARGEVKIQWSYTVQGSSAPVHPNKRFRNFFANNSDLVQESERHRSRFYGMD